MPNDLPPHAPRTADPVPPRRTKPLEYWLTRQLVRGLMLVGKTVPSRWIPGIGRALGSVCYRLMPRYRRVALANLERAFGESWTAVQREEVARESFRQIGLTLVEFFLRQPHLTPEQAGRLVAFEGEEHYAAAHAAGRGILLVTAHFGNWELMGPRLTRAGYRVNAVSRTADDPALERMIQEIRLRGGVKAVPRQQAAREGLRALRRNEILAILLDQNTAEGGVFVPFFGIAASTATGPAVFALKTGAPIVPTFCLREPDGTHRMRAWPPIFPCSSGDRAADVRRLTAEVTAVIEAQIRERPELWSWLHNRWKLRPETGEAAEGECLPVEKGIGQCSP